MTSPDLPISTDRLVLRSFTRDDFAGYAAYRRLPELQRHFDRPARDDAECRAALDMACRQNRITRPGDILTLAVTRARDNTVLGEISLTWTDATAAQAELDCILNPRFTGLGYAREAVRAALDHGFERFAFHRVFARCAAGNTRAVRLLKGLGMRLEAHFREHALYRGEWDDELLFAVLRREWRRGAEVKEFDRHRVA